MGPKISLASRASASPFPAVFAQLRGRRDRHNAYRVQATQELNMAMIQAATTAQILETPAHLSGADFAPSGTRWGRFDPLGWLVDLTEAAQVRLARAALAQGLPVDSSESGRF
jgi:hypothetical protein